MNIIRFAIKKPITVLVGVIILCLFGTLSLLTLPVQLTPNVDQPEITVQTTWEGASPREVEQQIIDVQEEELKSIQGMTKMTSVSSEGNASVKLEFEIGVDMSRALLDTADRLRQVKKYPDNVDQPTIRSGASDVSGAIAWFILKSLPPRDDIVYEYDYIKDFVKPRMERVSGVASINIYGGADKEIHIRVDPERLASRGLTLMDVRDAIQSRNMNVSAGNIEEGKREYVIRMQGQFKTLDDILETIIQKRNNSAIYLKDVAEVFPGYKKQRVVVRANGEPALALNATREAGTNVIEVMEGLHQTVKKINEELLNPLNLELVQVYDETLYIEDAISLVKSNLVIGGCLAIVVLLLFLRNLGTTFIISLAIPVSVVGTFLILKAFGRNINVISLAGMSFAVGMVVDNSIVVLENIYRHIEKGEEPFDAALKGGANVWGAVLSSTLTTLAVFIPVILIQEEAGQLFRDIAVAISAAVSLSLIVSVLFIPMAAARLLKPSSVQKKEGVFGSLLGIVPLASLFSGALVWFVSRVNRSYILRILTVSAMTSAALYITVTLWPPLSYLPDGNRNLVIGFLIPPPGYGKEELTRISKTIEKRLSPYLNAKPGSLEAEKLDGPLIKQYFIVSRGESVFIGLKARDPKKVKGLVALVQKSTATPGVFSFATQRSLFQRGLAAGN
ncbi:MAG: efflux RND transporter permease subunit, partial [Nitrospinota bacterium]